MARICIDPGHGGRDPGACGNGLREKDLTLHVSRRVENTLKSNYDNVYIFLTRTGDETLSLQQRTDKCNAWRADLFVSIHVNAGGGTGFESFVVPNARPETVNKQAIVHDAIMACLAKYGKRDRGKKTANFYVIKNTNPPAMLIECLFIDNANDAVLLKQTGFLDGLADAIARGIAKALGLKAKEVDELEQRAIIVHSSDDFPAAKRLAAKLNAGIFLRETAEKRVVAKEIYVVGGGRGACKGTCIDLSGSDYFETSAKVGGYCAKA